MKEYKYIYTGLTLMLAAMFVACSGEEDVAAVSIPITDKVEFVGGICRNDFQTRAPEDEDEWLDMPYDDWKWDNTPIDFYIHQQVTDKGTTNNNCKVYNLANGELGRLVVKEGQEALNWKSNDATHFFHTWTKPAGIMMDGSNETGTVDMANRNWDYEYFVGTTAGDLGDMTYAKNGLTVGLRFKHLVGKIVIEKMTRIASDGSTHDVNANEFRSIIFPNMPVKGTFTTGINSTDPQKTMVAEHTGEKDEFMAKGTDYLSYWENNKNNLPIYLLPQSFISEEHYGKFFVSVNLGGTIRTYEGNLNKLVDQNDETNPLTDIKAGECLTIRLILQDDKVTGYYVHIVDWNEQNVEDQKDKPYPSIKSAQDILSHYKELGSNRFELVLDDFIFGTDEKGNNIVRLSDNIDLSNVPNVTLVIPKGYILDGCNCNINCPGLKLEGEYMNVYINGEEI